MLLFPRKVVIDANNICIKYYPINSIISYCEVYKIQYNYNYYSSKENHCTDKNMYSTV